MKRIDVTKHVSASGKLHGISVPFDFVDFQARASEFLPPGLRSELHFYKEERGAGAQNYAV